MFLINIFYCPPRINASTAMGQTLNSLSKILFLTSHFLNKASWDISYVYNVYYFFNNNFFLFLTFLVTKIKYIYIYIVPRAILNKCFARINHLQSSNKITVNAIKIGMLR